MKFPLLPYSQLVFDMQKTNVNVYASKLIVRLNKEDVDVIRLKRGIEQAFRNHPVFFMPVDQQGMQEYIPQSDVLHGQYHSVNFKDDGMYVEVTVANNRILGDAKSESILIEDIVRAYLNLPLQQDDYLNYLQHMEDEKRSPRYAANRQWLEAEYGYLSCPVHPNTDAPIDMMDVPIEGILMDDYSLFRSAVNHLSEGQLIPVSAFFSLAAALAMMEYNGCDEAALTWAYEGRESKEEQHIYGSLHRDVPFRIKYSNDRKELLKAARNQIRQGIAHSSYPFTLTYPHTEKWNYALNVLVQTSMQAKTEVMPFPFDLVEPQNAQHMAYSLLDVEVYDEEQLTLLYRYSATHYKESSINKFAALVRKYAEWLLSD